MSTILYIAVAVVITGMVPFNLLNTASPVSFALQYVGVQWAFTVISVGAIAGLTTVVLVNMFSKARIIFAMSRDGLLPKVFSNVKVGCQAPVASILLRAGLIAAIIAAFFSLGSIFELVNVGALSAFIFLALAVIILRRECPEMKRSFKCPLVPAIPLLSIILCLALLSQLKFDVIELFIIWIGLGVVVYFIYGKYRGKFDSPDQDEHIENDIDGFEPPIEYPPSK